MSCRYLRISSLFSTVFLITLALIFSWGLYINPVIAENQEKAPIVIDGQQIFEIGESGNQSAKERAQEVNNRLRQAVRSDQTIEVTVPENQKTPQILLNNQQLLTVTPNDIEDENSPQTQAQIWGRQIQNSLINAQSQRSLGYLRNMTLVSVGIILLAFALSWLLGFLRGRFLEKIIEQLNKTSARFAGADLVRGLTVLLHLLLITARLGIWIVSILYIANLFPYTRQWSYRITSILISSFTSSFVSLGSRSYTVIDFLILGGLLFTLVIVAGSATNILRTRVLSAAGINRGAQEAIAILAKYSFIVIGGLVLLQVWGLELSSLTILASALSIGVGFGLQDIAKNFGSGLVLVFERPIQVGDFIEVGKLNGTVERIGARSTEIRTLDHVSIIVPNSRFLESEVVNWSHRNPISRLHIPVGVSYSANPETVRQILLAAVQSHPSVLASPPPSILFKRFGDSSLDFELLIWTSEPHKQFVTISDLYFDIFKALAEHNIEIPFPQRDLHIRSGTLGLSPEIEAALVRLSKSNFHQYNQHHRDQDSEVANGN
ncbi:mechanosensitive ion channel family protein [Calothrix sp. NIES-3974]|uniref:mechanosensitive ion channel family protein n=1 Tax=Calothrix sp. NIES-3974 TaxID=2005462 RepID=UPI000B6025F1|nr:mechanosensitive ion channel domain-containing protein [Calothrix sp. NIES-3974]BAZ06045.1 MscS mechanosensitive ion channel family protein [Calothrix sp. NIES-3974]